MQSREFPFMDLPLELRLMIWKHAVRPMDFTPGAHFFSITNAMHDGNEAARLSVCCGDFCYAHDPDSEHFFFKHDPRVYHLAAPKFHSSQGTYSHSWTKNNPSAYLWDFGMWRTCRESRRVIRTHYKRQKWGVKLSHGTSTLPLPPYEKSCLRLTVPRNGEDWRFFFHPKRDLLCLQAFNPSTINWWGMYWWKDNLVMEDLCIANSRLRFSGFENVAMEYDPSWNDIKERADDYNFSHLFRENSPRGFFLRTLAILNDGLYQRAFSREVNHRRRPLWLIDYNLKRSPIEADDDGHSAEGKNKVFHGNGLTFTEVDKQSRHSYSSGDHSSALGFLENLDVLLDGCSPSLHIRHNLPSPFGCPSYGFELHDPSAPQYRANDQIRVLMCEKST